jgi:serine-type D-Ala-D-Ala carboxypeptidase (penicillin-binding protein 5/6)
MARRRTLGLVLIAAVVAVTGPAAGQSVPPPTPVPPDGSPSPYPTALATPVPSAEPPRVDAAAAALGDLDSGEVLWQRRGGERRPIASITKIMTALLVLETAEPREVVTASASAAGQAGAELGLEAGEEVPVRDLLLALMLQSANDAAVALAEHVAGSVEAFVDGMNRRARELGLPDTRFASPNGLDDSGYSSARDLVALTAEAFEEPGFGRIVSTTFHRIPDPDQGDDPRRIQNRNALLWLYPGAVGVKTGYTAAAGFCLVAAADRSGLRLVGVVLGSPDEAFTQAATVLNHGYAAYERRTIVQEGQRLDPVEVQGRSVPAVAGGSVDALLPRGQPVSLSFRPRAGLTLPVAEADQLGVMEATAGGESLGEVPVMAAAPVSQAVPAEDDDPWWLRALKAVGRALARVFRAVFG